MEDFGMDSRMQTRECSGLYDRGKRREDGRKTHKGTLERHTTAFSRPFRPL